ncbi:MAG: mechanosensitive ion channel family protein [Bryobacteraceae bacterium]
MDPLNRVNPRSTVTAFLQACHQDDFNKAAQYLDLTRIPARQRAQQGPKLAQDLESLLNTASQFDVLQLSQDPQGNLADDPDPTIEHVATVVSNEQKFTLQLQRSQPANAPQAWLFAATTVAKVPQLVPIPSTESKIEARLPRVLVATLILETPLWKWIALFLVALILVAAFRMVVNLFQRSVQSVAARFRRTGSFAWMQAIVDPTLVLLSVMVFRIFEQMIAPAALTRVYVDRALLMVVVASFAWGLINLLDFLIVRLDRRLNQRQRVVSHSVIYLGRRVLKTVIAIFAAILILDNWGFNMTTIIAGLGVGGIAVALAAQQTIANVFGGVSVIGDAPVMVGDFGNFGGVVGTIEDIGLRSARVRTLSRSIVSIPNSAFAGMNLENYAVRDKILFNPTFGIKRTTSQDQIRRLLKSVGDMLARNKQVEVRQPPARISGYSMVSFTVEVFAYVLTTDMNEFYKHQDELYLAINEVVTSLNIELA